MIFTYPWPNELQPDEERGPKRKRRKYFKNFTKYLKFVGDNNFDNWWGFMDRDMAILHGHRVPQDDMVHCICTHDIKQNCFIINKSSGLCLTVGNCCIKKFLKKENYRKRCIKCKKLYRGKYRNCKECRVDIGEFYSKRVNFGKYCGKKVSELMDDSNYVQWLYGLNIGDIHHNLMREIHEFIEWKMRMDAV